MQPLISLKTLIRRIIKEKLRKIASQARNDKPFYIAAQCLGGILHFVQNDIVVVRVNFVFDAQIRSTPLRSAQDDIFWEMERS